MSGNCDNSFQITEGTQIRVVHVWLCDGTERAVEKVKTNWKCPASSDFTCLQSGKQIKGALAPHVDLDKNITGVK